MENVTREGDSPVCLIFYIKCMSKARHVESCLKIGGPPSKPKYFLITDSELVPWGNGEKNPKKGVKRTWNWILTSSRSFKKSNDVPFA